MDNLLQTIKAIFVQISDGDLQRFVMPKNGKDGISEIYGSLTRILQHGLPTYTLDQIENVKQLMLNTWMKAGERLDMRYREGKSVLNMLLHVSAASLTMQDGRPVCKFSELMRWHNVTSIISEDILTTAFLASRDARNDIKRTDFCWLPVLPHNNKSLNAITEREITDLHHHLNGSSLTVELNWLVAMNRLCSVNDCKAFSQNLRTQIFSSDDDREIGLYTRLVKAAALRLYLYYKVNNYKTSVIDVQRLFCLSTTSEAQTEAIALKNLLNAVKGEGKTFCIDKDKGTNDVPDYAIPSGMEESDYAILVGERKLLYDAFMLVYSNKADYITEQMLYAYLVMKCKFRNELIQTNEYTGFANFAEYQGRKTSLIAKGSVYEALLIRLAVGAFTHGEENRNHYLETRISPSASVSGNYQTMKWIGKLNEDDGQNYDFVFHFIKKRDKTKPQSYAFKCRHHALREETKQKAVALAKLRNSSEEEGKHIVGIDAASSEINCRPEVFAHAFRYLRNTTAKRTTGKSPLGITYHVGEDYLDVVDGLRAVDEAMRFLEMRDGDRIGHGLLLGVDVRKYYEKRYMIVTTTAQVWLDDVVWLYIMCQNYDKGKRRHELKEWYDEYYHKLFPNSHMADIDTYYRSMLLRGDDPELYNVEGLSKGEVVRSDEWGMYGKCMEKEVQRARQDKEACKLYYMYHYDGVAKTEGNKSVEVKITPDFIENVRAIQHVMIDKIEHSHIAIECNPSSNFRIGDFDRYIEHPIFKFFNKEIKTPYAQRCLNVSVNTDDKGVFSTSLEREYSLLAWALEKEGAKNVYFQNSPYEIARWLDSIRQMGIGQKFRQ